MRRIVLLLALVCIAGAAQAEFLGIKKSSERVTFRLKEPLDSAYGIERKPDSVHIWIRCDTGTVASATPLDYKARSTTYPFADITNTPIDTTKDYGDTAYWFTGVLSNFGTTTMSQVTISVDLYTGKYSRTTDATYQVIADSLTYDLKQGRDSAGLAAKGIKQANDSLALYDTRWDSTLAVFADANTLMKNRLLRIRDSVDVILDTLQNQDNWVASATNLTKALDSINAILDTLQVTDTRWDSTLAVFADANTLFKNRLLRIRDSIDAILDTLQLYDASGHLPVNAAKIGGTTQTGLDIGSYLPAAIDTILLLNGVRTGGKAIFKVSADKDTLYIYSRDGSTLLFRTVYVHPGGSPGDPPDTSRSVGP